MIWKTDTHLFSATLCQQTGEPCPALARMAEKLAGAMTTAAPMTAEDFKVEGTCTLEHCPSGCAARFEAGHGRIRVFCGVDADADGDRLNQFADMLLHPEAGFLPSGWLTRMPCALLEGIPIEQPARTAAHHAAL
ncbi:hypothetical protein FGK63_11760 [Ruegeria sediminis]|uniref:DUF1636 domain-containing protein n=1 Tax=Ruegeria sediminis TaxID=2583820 RepID=A0ABY2WVK6_9RHOB|nr:hypothetical protein [Ruegeria sediminis]TMV06794.1 hypothetical protein FGK63_11760 [Ruegeria sediminis]